MFFIEFSDLNCENAEYNLQSYLGVDNSPHLRQQNKYLSLRLESFMGDFESMTEEEFSDFVKNDAILAWDQYEPFEYPFDMNHKQYISKLFPLWQIHIEGNPAAFKDGPYSLLEKVHFRLINEIKLESNKQRRMAEKELAKKTENIERLMVERIQKVEEYLERKVSQDGKSAVTRKETRFLKITALTTLTILALYAILPSITRIQHSHFGMLGDTLAIVAIAINTYALILLSSSLRDEADHDMTVLFMEWLNNKK